MATSIGDMIMFIAAISAASVMAGIIVDQGVDMAQAMDTRATQQELALTTGIEVLNDPATTTDSDLDIVVLNTGATTIHSNQLVLLIDGTSAVFTATIFGGGDALLPGEMVTLTVAGSQPAGDRVIEVLGPNGSRDIFRYYEAGP